MAGRQAASWVRAPAADLLSTSQSLVMISKLSRVLATSSRVTTAPRRVLGRAPVPHSARGARDRPSVQAGMPRHARWRTESERVLRIQGSCHAAATVAAAAGGARGGRPDGARVPEFRLDADHLEVSPGAGQACVNTGWCTQGSCRHVQLCRVPASCRLAGSCNCLESGQARSNQPRSETTGQMSWTLVVLVLRAVVLLWTKRSKR